MRPTLTPQFNCRRDWTRVSVSPVCASGGRTAPAQRITKVIQQPWPFAATVPLSPDDDNHFVTAALGLRSLEFYVHTFARYAELAAFQRGNKIYNHALLIFDAGAGTPATVRLIPFARLVVAIEVVEIF